jgi:hypothetical protein
MDMESGIYDLNPDKISESAYVNLDKNNNKKKILKMS